MKHALGKEVPYIVATLPYTQAVKYLRKKVIHKESKQCCEEAALATERTWLESGTTL